MYSLYFKKTSLSAQFIALTLIISLLWISSPLSIQAQEPEASSQEEASSSSDADSSESGSAEEEESRTSADSTEAGQEGVQGSADGDVSVTTGDAVAEGTIANETNTTATTPDGNAEESNGLDTGSETGTSTSSKPEKSSTTASTTNEATVDNDATLEALTGSSTATAEEGEATIETGDAFAGANVINVINTNIFNSFGLLLLLNALFGSGTFDLRDFNIDWLTAPHSGYATSTCSLETCSDNGVSHTITSSSTATIYNDVVVRAITGGNSASGDGASISTGDAYAGANIVNVANSNFVDSNYLLVSLNNFGDMSGDIVLPGKNFFLSLFSRLGAALGQLFAANNNTANVDNSVNVSAETGANTASSTEGGAAVSTGDANAGANVVNHVNTNLFNTDSVYILLRIHGNWSGNIFGLPEGLSWAQTSEGIHIFSTGEGSSSGGNTSITNNNNASIYNKVNVVALTGENKVDAETGEALIETGKAKAAANIINVANTNVVGRNWILAVFNIFGNWSGNLSFGRPDLWIGGQAQAGDTTVGPGTEVEYRFTVTNNGDADMTGVVLKTLADSSLLEFEGAEIAIDSGAGWNLGNIPSGETLERTIKARVTKNLPFGQIPINLTASVSGRETDNDVDDNSEEIGIVAERKGSSRGSDGKSGPAQAFLYLSKEVLSPVVTAASSTVDYAITIHNAGRSPAYGAVLYDTLKNATGDSVHEQSWSLGNILPGEEIKVTYSVNFSSSTHPGLYTNTAYVAAMDDRTIRYKKGNANSEEVMAIVNVVGTENGVIACEPYLSSYLKRNGNNNASDVEKLQRFLNEKEGASLGVSGVFDEATESAVRAFQNRYSQDILGPWGVEGATGNVYFLTQKKINEIACGGSRTFALTPAQLRELGGFRQEYTDVQETEGRNAPVPAGRDVGLTDGDAVLASREEQSDIEGLAGNTQVAAAGNNSLGTNFLGSLLQKVKSFVTSVPRVQASDFWNW